MLNNKSERRLIESNTLKSSMIHRRAEFLLCVTALSIFALGALVYLFDRSAADIYFIPEWWRFADGTPALFGSLGYSLPSFAHTYCFILLIGALLTPWRITPLALCIGWSAVETFLELAQSEGLAGRILAALPDWFADWPVLANVPGYFAVGRFDPFDLAAIVLGGVAAWLTLFFTQRLFSN